MMIFSQVTRVMSQSVILRMDSTHCFMVCQMPIKYSTDTVSVIDVAEKKKQLRIPEVFQIEYDTIIDWSQSIQKKYPPVYMLNYKRNGTLELKPYGNNQDDYFFLKKKYMKTENRTRLKEVSYDNIELPALYTEIQVTKMLPNQQLDKTVQVLCPDKITTGIILQIKRELKAKGYTIYDVTSDQMNQNFFDALSAYQRENDLPIGGINYPTLESFDIMP
ncbi:MAG: hypothetical protein ACK5QZ_11505 [Bacteroidota bacterium]